MRTYKDLSELIGNTPLLRLERLAPEHTILAKCEMMNPLSIKDRPVLQIIEDAEREGHLSPGSTLIRRVSLNPPVEPSGVKVAMIFTRRLSPWRYASVGL